MSSGVLAPGVREHVGYSLSTQLCVTLLLDVGPACDTLPLSVQFLRRIQPLRDPASVPPEEMVSW